MKKNIKNIIWPILFILVVSNIYIFVSGIKISDEINRYESEITKIHQENIDLEKKTYEVESLKYTASMAASLNFIEKPAPLILNKAAYALNR